MMQQNETAKLADRDLIQPIQHFNSESKTLSCAHVKQVVLFVDEKRK